MTPAIRALKKAGVRFEVLEYEHDPRASSYGLEAAEVLGIEPGSVYKTLVAKLDGRGLVVAVVPVSAKLDLKALARAAGAKRAEMADPAEAQRSTGYVLGGISPFGQRKRLRTYVHAEVSTLEVVHVSGGRRGLEVAISPADLEAVVSAVLAPLASP